MHLYTNLSYWKELYGGLSIPRDYYRCHARPDEDAARRAAPLVPLAPTRTGRDIWTPHPGGRCWARRRPSRIAPRRRQKPFGKAHFWLSTYLRATGLEACVLFLSVSFPRREFSQKKNRRFGAFMHSLPGCDYFSSSLRSDALCVSHVSHVKEKLRESCTHKHATPTLRLALFETEPTTCTSCF